MSLYLCWVYETSGQGGCLHPQHQMFDWDPKCKALKLLISLGSPAVFCGFSRRPNTVRQAFDPNCCLNVVIFVHWLSREIKETRILTKPQIVQIFPLCNYGTIWWKHSYLCLCILTHGCVCNICRLTQGSLKPAIPVVWILTLTMHREPTRLLSLSDLVTCSSSNVAVGSCKNKLIRSVFVTQILLVM